MSSTAATPSVVLLVGTAKWLGQVLELNRHVVIEEHNGADLPTRLEGMSPDVVVVQDVLSDMTGIEACRLVRERGCLDQVPLLILTPSRPSPAQRVAGLRSGVWDFLLETADRAELILKLEAYAQARRSIGTSLPRASLAPDSPANIEDRFGSPWSLVRRARDLCAVLMRQDGALACVEFRVPDDISRTEAGHLLVRNTRRSDVVGVWEPGGLTVLAPWVTHDGAVGFALRVGRAFRADLARRGLMVLGPGLPVGYDAVTRTLSTPADPTELLIHAATALREGEPDPRYPWIRRFSPSPESRGQDLSGIDQLTFRLP